MVTDGPLPPIDERVSGDLEALDLFAQELSQLRTSGGDRSRSSTHEQIRGTEIMPSRIDADPENAEHGLAKLVLTLVDILRQLLEKQAIRRMEAGSLSEVEIERLGETFLRLNQKLDELKAAFGLEDDDLRLNLGPIRDLLSEPLPTTTSEKAEGRGSPRFRRQGIDQ